MIEQRQPLIFQVEWDILCPWPAAISGSGWWSLPFWSREEKL
jgi:hypothetical protein